MAIPTPIRWTIEQASREFNMDRKTMTKRMTELSILPGEDQRYSTGQIEAAKYGDIAGEKLGRAKAERVTAELKAGQLLGEGDKKHPDALILATDAEQTLADYGAGVRSVIESQRDLSDEQKRRIFIALENLKIDEK